MVATLQSSVGKMNDLLARLAQHNKGRTDERVAVPLGRLLEALASDKRKAHPVLLDVRQDCAIVGDPQRVEQIVAHLVQNAIDASPADQPVEISLCAAGREAQIVIPDRGGGMSASFIRDQLFKPFVSTKTGGFGIGAFESREIVRAMGGSLDVWSREGEGTRFTVHLPLADNAVPEIEKKARATANGIE